VGVAIVGQNVSMAWLSALEFLLCQGRDVVNLAVTIEHPLDEDVRIRAVLDRFIADRRKRNSRRVELVSTVANTIFPNSLYIPRLGLNTRTHLYEMSDIARPVSRRRNRRGTYFERLIAWPLERETVNQLEKVIVRIRNAQEQGRNTENALELGLADPRDNDTALSESTSALPVYRPGQDNNVMGFPCLSHVSLSLMDGRLHMTALYRNHEFVRRAYGNYVGLGWLLGFLARESGSEVGELMCVSSHADPDIGHGAGFGQKALRDLVVECRAAVASASFDME
jgi:hypothetical protein